MVVSQVNGISSIIRWIWTIDYVNGSYGLNRGPDHQSTMRRLGFSHRSSWCCGKITVETTAKSNGYGWWRTTNGSCECGKMFTPVVSGLTLQKSHRGKKSHWDEPPSPQVMLISSWIPRAHLGPQRVPPCNPKNDAKSDERLHRRTLAT